MKLDELNELKERFMHELRKSLSHCPNKNLYQVLRYALCGEGKRLRPLLVLASALASRTHQTPLAIKLAMPAALAVEYIHTYSLIHDDLPAMDDDDYRRGRLSVHRQFDEALAILAGDALLADAFLMAALAPRNPSLLCAELALSSGRHGLVSGQAEDLQAAGSQKPSAAAWLSIHAKKTARLFEACTACGAMSQGLGAQEIGMYRTFGHHFGMAFQLKDDIDDQEGFFAQEGEQRCKLLIAKHVATLDSALDALPSADLLRLLVEQSFGPFR